MIEWLKLIFFGPKIEELNEIQKALDAKLSEVKEIYTTIKSFRGMDTGYYGWVCSVIERDEYRFMMFDLRENIIREMAAMNDKEQISRSIGRLDMIGIIDNYLKRYKKEYEDSIRRDPEAS